jgi:chaperonin GroEL
MAFAYQKVKSVSKCVEVAGPRLDKIILDTMKTISDAVGATLGPGGRPVMIERQEHGFPPLISKDGVTVYRALGFDGAIEQTLMESTRDASVRTANSAGDGTTTATVLSYNIVKAAYDYRTRNPKVSPQRLVRRLMTAFRDLLEPHVKQMSIKADFSSDDGRQLLWNVAKLSANGDSELADAVMEAFDVSGDEGNITISEVSGPSGFEVESIEGFSLPSGYDDSTGRFAPKFINEPSTQRVWLEKPVFVVYHGRVTDAQQIVSLLEKIATQWQEHGGRFNVVLAATGFAESVLATLALNFERPDSLKIYPLQVPISPLQDGQLGTLEDIATVTGAKILDPLNSPFDMASLEDLGYCAKAFEAYRFRCTLLPETNDAGELHPDVALNIEAQVDKLKAHLVQAPSELDTAIINERVAKLTGGIARLKVVGSSFGELRERRDRAEDAVCAVRGAIRHGVLPGGCWMLLKLARLLEKSADPILVDVMAKALQSPVEKLLTNAGYNDQEISEIVAKLVSQFERDGEVLVYDVLDGKFVNPLEGGILDSTPAVLEALRNSLSIAAQIGTLGAAVVFKRDGDLERAEARDTIGFLKDADQYGEKIERP